MTNYICTYPLRTGADSSRVISLPKHLDVCPSATTVCRRVRFHLHGFHTDICAWDKANYIPGPATLNLGILLGAWGVREFHLCLRDRLIVLCMCEDMKLLLMSSWATSAKTCFKTVSFSIGFNVSMIFLHRFWSKKVVTIKVAYSTGTFLYWKSYAVFKKLIQQQCPNPLNSLTSFESIFFYSFQPLFSQRKYFI